VIAGLPMETAATSSYCIDGEGPQPHILGSAEFSRDGSSTDFSRPRSGGRRSCSTALRLDSLGHVDGRSGRTDALTDEQAGQPESL
jgi:hypothetical protein